MSVAPRPRSGARRSPRRRGVFPIMLVAAAACCPAAFAEYRVALVIGNSAYPKAELASPPNDVRAVADALEKRGFVVTTAENLKGGDFAKTVNAFAVTVPIRGTALVYFSGYATPLPSSGSSPPGDNQLVGVDNGAASVRNLLSTFVGGMHPHIPGKGGSAATILVLDGCNARPGAPQPGLVKQGRLLPESLVIHAAPFGQLLSPVKEGLSPLAERFVKELASDKPLDQVIATLGADRESTLPSLAFLAVPASKAVSPPNLLEPGKKPGDEWVDSRGSVFCWCPPGSVTIGSGSASLGHQPDEVPVAVEIPQGFWMSKYEVVRDGVQAVVNAWGTGVHKLRPINDFSVDFDQEFKPIPGASGLAAIAARFNKTAPPGWEYVLPSEAEWEYAARAGTTTAYSFGDDPAQLARYGNFADRSLRECSLPTEQYLRNDEASLAKAPTGLVTYAHKTWDDGQPLMAQVGCYLPNPWGLHDMHGNVSEITRTFYDADRKPVEAKGRVPVVKGGSWQSLPEYCRSAFRGRFSRSSREAFIGARFMLRQKPVDPPEPTPDTAAAAQQPAKQ